MVLIALPAMLAVLGLVLDAGLMCGDSQNLRQISDASALAGAMELRLGKSAQVAEATSSTYLQAPNGVPGVLATVNIPPATGPYAGGASYVEVLVSKNYNTRIMQLLAASPQPPLMARSVAGVRAATADAAIVILDPNPPELTLLGLPVSLPALPTVIGGMEVLGVGTLNVNGAVLVNTAWGGVDEDGNAAGNGPPPPYALSCTPLIGLTRLNARDIRVAGGVDDPDNYGGYPSGQSARLRANRLPVPDPFADLPAPTTASDPINVRTQLYGHVSVTGLPLITPPTVLQPGVYESIEVISGTAVFQPGIYIVRGVNATSQIALNLAGGSITANGVMFYVTNSAAYEPTVGSPDAADGDASPTTSINSQVASVVLNAAVFDGSFTPLSAPGSPFDGLLVYQRRLDRRPIVIVQQSLLGQHVVSGTIYAKWGHLLFAGMGTHDLRIVSGTARFLVVNSLLFSPTRTLPPARDVYLVE